MLSPLLANYTEADLLAAMEWALTRDTFWPTKLFATTASYFVEKAPTIVTQWRGEARAAANAQKPAAKLVERSVNFGLLDHI